LLVKNDYSSYSGGGTIFALEDGASTTLTSDSGHRMVTWDSPGFQRYDIQNHIAWDLTAPVGSQGILSPESGTMQLSNTEKGGLISTLTTEDAVERLQYKHLSTQTVMDFISVFGMEGTSIDEHGLLSGVQGGTVIGHMGNTGTATTGAHLHLAYQQYDSMYDKWNSFDPSEYDGYNSLKDAFNITPYAELASGWSDKVWTIEKLASAYEYSNSWQAPYDFNGEGVNYGGGLIASQGSSFSEDTWERFLREMVNW
jgi:hypothetical protein